jgi:hypothetical protein
MVRFIEASNIEKENLEAHVELCAQRHGQLMEKMEAFEGRMTVIEKAVADIKALLTQAEKDAYRKLIGIGITIIGSLVTAIIGMALYILKNTPIPLH